MVSVDDGAAEQDAELEADDGDERDRRVLERVLVGDDEGPDAGRRAVRT